MAYTGLLGGEIRHTEVRPGYVAPPEEHGNGGARGANDGDARDRAA